MSRNHSAPIPVEWKKMLARQIPGEASYQPQPSVDEAIKFDQSMKWREMLKSELQAQCLGHGLLDLS